MTTDQAKILISTDNDFCYSKRANYSVQELMKKYPEGAPDRVIAAVLLLVEEDVNLHYARIVARLQEIMGITTDDT